MIFARENKSDIIDRYVNKTQSIHEIAEFYETYPNKIWRALKFLGVKLRDKSESTKVAIKSGRKKHPTEGGVRSDEDKIKISEGRAKAWKNLSNEKKEDIIKRAKERWEEMPSDKKAEMQRLSNEAIRKTSKEGSSLELYLHKNLIKHGYDCFHHNSVLENMKLEVDLFIPSLKLAIEIDGPSHFLPIWGEENLIKHQNADRDKNALLKNRKFSVIRVQLHIKNMSNKNKRDILAMLIKEIDRVSSLTEPQVVYLEVK